MIRVSIIDRATPALRQILARARPEQVHKVAAFGVRNLVRDHLAALNQKPNKRGWKKTQFYAQARRAVTARASTSAGIVEISKEGFAQRLYGGPIRPVNTRALTIPALAIAYGRRAREFTNLQFRPINRGNLVGLLYRKTDQGPVTLYWLVKRVMQQPDPTVLPTNDEMATAAVKAVEDNLAPLLDR
jgi:hypothetical protein